jgi:hypothetical protein
MTGVGKRFALTDHLTYSPSFSVTKFADVDPVFDLNFLAISYFL